RRYDDTFSRSESVGFDHDRAIETVEGLQRLVRIPGGEECSGGDSGVAEELLGEDLATLELRGSGGRSDNLAARSAEDVDDSGDQRCLRTHDGEIGVNRFGQCQQRPRRAVADWNERGQSGHASIAGCGKERVGARAL